MARGTPIGRPWVVVLRDGAIAIDWGDGLFQDAISGSFFNARESQVSHKAQDGDLDWLTRIGRVDSYNEQTVFFISLPERITRAME